MSAEPAKSETFWSAVRWPRHEAVVVLVAVPVGFLLAGWVYDGPTYGAVSAAVMTAVCGVLWAAHRVLKAWAHWPTESRLAAALKAAVRFLLTDP